MKQLLVLSVLILGACAPAQKEYTVIREQSRPAAVEQTPTPPAPAPKALPICPTNLNVAPQMMASAPVYYSGTYTMQQPTVQYVMPAEMAYQQQTVMATMPAAQQYTMQQAYVTQQTQEPTYMMPSTPAQQPMAQQPTIQQPQEGMALSENTTIIILQHPTNRDLVKCSFNNTTCLSSYEAQGYVQLRNAPHFAGYNDVPAESDYPSRRWRDNNNIPRW